MRNLAFVWKHWITSWSNSKSKRHIYCNLASAQVSPCLSLSSAGFNAYFSKPKQGTLELPLYLWALRPWSRLWHQENMFGKRNVQQAFTSRYLSSEVGWTGEGGGGVVCVCVQPGYVMAGRERDRQEPVSMPIPVPDVSEAPLTLRAVQPSCRPSRDKRAPLAAAYQEYRATAVRKCLQRWRWTDPIQPSGHNVCSDGKESCLSLCPSELAPHDKSLWRLKSQGLFFASICRRATTEEETRPYRIIHLKKKKIKEKNPTSN